MSSLCACLASKSPNGGITFQTEWKPGPIQGCLIASLRTTAQIPMRPVRVSGLFPVLVYRSKYDVRRLENAAPVARVARTRRTFVLRRIVVSFINKNDSAIRNAMIDV